MPDVEQKVEIYSLKTNSWKTIQGGIPYGNVSIPAYRVEGGILVNESICWAVRWLPDPKDDGWGSFYDMILAFDLIEDKFGLVKAPPPDDDDAWEPILVHVRGCLGSYQMQFRRCVIIWVLKEEENKNGCWTKLMKIPVDFKMHFRPTFIVKDDEVLFSITNNKSGENGKMLVVYN